MFKIDESGKMQNLFQSFLGKSVKKFLSLQYFFFKLAIWDIEYKYLHLNLGFLHIEISEKQPQYM